MSTQRAIPLQLLDLAPLRTAPVSIEELLPGEIDDVVLRLVSIVPGARHVAPASADHDVVWLFISGDGVLRTETGPHAIRGETIARMPLGWPVEIEAGAETTLRALEVRKRLTPEDALALSGFPDDARTPHVKAFGACPAYGEAIKSAQTVSRTLLPENYVPRVAMGTVETIGPDRVAPHRHPMLEQLFLGLADNDVTVSADDVHVRFPAFAILHIPLGSNHGVDVAAGKKLRYVWMDFFVTREGQEWLKMHKPV
jgi:hypothetical protein